MLIHKKDRNEVFSRNFKAYLRETEHLRISWISRQNKLYGWRSMSKVPRIEKQKYKSSNPPFNFRQTSRIFLLFAYKTQI